MIPASTIAKLATLGLTPEQAAAVAEMLTEVEISTEQKSAAEIQARRANDRDRKARQRHGKSRDVTGQDVTNGTPAPPLPSRACSLLEEVSKLSLEADASKGGEPPSKDVTPDQALFRRAKEVFGKSCGGQITKLKRHCGGDVGDTRAIVEQAALAENPGEYLAAVLARSSARASFSRDGPSRSREQQLSFAERMENFVNRGSENDQNDSGRPSIIDGNVLVLPGRR